jgi:hypothetical protein
MEICWDYEGFKPKKRKFLYKSVKTKKGYARIAYYDCVCTFDIECTTIDDPVRPYAFMYNWQFCFDNDKVYMGRTFQDFRRFIQALKHSLKLRPDVRLVVYVHNLSYEYEFIHDFLEIYDVFQMGPHKILYFIAEGIEFRCSYLLTNMSLSKLCKNTPTCVHKKLNGSEYGYTKLRTPADELTEEELEYCYNDVKGLAECIEYRLQDCTLATIPKTATGYVRREMRGAMKKNPINRQIFKDTALTPFNYRLMRMAFRGGDTHSNPKFTNRLITEEVKVKDIKSSYPAVLVEQTYPMGPFEQWDPVEYMKNYDYYYPKFCAIINVIYEGIEYVASDNMPYIPASKCFELSQPVYDNGRVRYAKGLQIVVTDIDFNIIENSYHYRKRTVVGVYASPRGKLPQEFIDTVMHFFKTKSLLDGDPDKKYEYAKAKANLNSTYGMCVTKLDRQQVEWHGELCPINRTLEELLKEYYDSESNFLPYQYGVWCTSWARLRLRTALQLVGADAVYCDTDSVFYVGDHEKDFEELNKKLKAMAIKHNATAVNAKGETLYLGVFEDDKIFTGGFKTLGAKKYIGRLQDGSMYCTIAGVSKTAGAAYFDEHGFDAFKEGTAISNSGHLIAFYNESPKHYITVNGCRILTASNIALINQDYTIGLTNDYKKLLIDQAKGILHKYI